MVGAMQLERKMTFGRSTCGSRYCAGGTMRILQSVILEASKICDVSEPHECWKLRHKTALNAVINPAGESMLTHPDYVTL
jgi:hypothetical protein